MLLFVFVLVPVSLVETNTGVAVASVSIPVSVRSLVNGTVATASASSNTTSAATSDPIRAFISSGPNDKRLAVSAFAMMGFERASSLTNPASYKDCIPVLETTFPEP